MDNKWKRPAPIPDNREPFIAEDEVLVAWLSLGVLTFSILSYISN